MDFLVNDLSLHGQFPDITSFRIGVQRVMVIRQIARRFGRSLHCNRNMLHAQITVDKALQQAVQLLSMDERRALMQWITQHGPFWEDERCHGPDEWLEVNGNIVTDSAVGEAAWCFLNGNERGLVSFVPSNWQFSPVAVDWVSNSSSRETTYVPNYWEPASVETILQNSPSQLTSWNQLKGMSAERWPRLTFGTDAFESLIGYPFVSGAANRLIFLLDTLNCFKSCFDENGQRTAQGNDIYRNFFTGKKEGGGRGALFSDSSEDEKNKFEKELSFKNPDNPVEVLFCPWHGKVQTPQLRIHFSSPISAENPLYVVYVGPKLTKR